MKMNLFELTIKNHHCPNCQAAKGQSCVNIHGRPVVTHAERMRQITAVELREWMEIKEKEEADVAALR